MSILIKGARMPRCCEVCPCNDDNWRCGALGDTFDILGIDDLERKPSDCPLVEVVRCKDCKYWNKEKSDEVKDFGYCKCNDEYFTDTDYCSYGERKDDE